MTVPITGATARGFLPGQLWRGKVSEFRCCALIGYAGGVGRESPAVDKDARLMKIVNIRAFDPCGQFHIIRFEGDGQEPDERY
ncbi:MAG: hypothetical protein GDA53_00165 [Rhodobacteraceae bacterium]|nr:hypothetical protein [Paracoccaceae bacterium]